MGNKVISLSSYERLEVRDEPVEGFVMGVGDTLFYDGEYVERTVLGTAEISWPVALVPGKGAFCTCDRCTGQYHGNDANSYGKYGYSCCLSVKDNPCGDSDVSQGILDRIYQFWARECPELTAEADLVALRELVRRFLDRKASFADLRREAAKWGA